MEIVYVILLIVFGIGLLLAEIFLIPGIGIAGFLGVGSLAAGTIVAYLEIGSLAGHITLASAVITTGVAIYLTIRSKALDKMSLDTKIDSSVQMPSAGKHMEQMQEHNNE